MAKPRQGESLGEFSCRITAARLAHAPKPALGPRTSTLLQSPTGQKCSTIFYSHHPFTLGPPRQNSFLLLRSLNDQVYSQPIFDPMLIQRVSILQDLPSKDQNQLILFGLKPPGNLFFELKNKQSLFQAKDQDQKFKANTPDIISTMQTA